jgi:hypothetical protein
MSHRLQVLLLEAAALDPRFKRKAFRWDRAPDKAYQHLCISAARLTTSRLRE